MACLLTLCLVPRSYNEPHVLSQATVTPAAQAIETPPCRPEPKSAEPLLESREAKKTAKALTEKSLAVASVPQTPDAIEPAETTPETAPQPEVTSADMAIVEQQVSRALIEKMVVDNLLNEIMIESHQQTSSKDEYTL